MYKFGKTSLERLEHAHPAWKIILEEVLGYMDVSVICTHRSKEDQESAFREGRSKVRWPNSKHNSYPSIAVDVVPYPVDWKNLKRFGYMAGLIRIIAEKHGYTVRWGGDWDSDGETEDQIFHDLPHFELVNK